MKPLTPQQRETLLSEHLQALLEGEQSEGQLLRKLRKEVLGLNQERYAELVGVSRRTLSDIENDVGSQSIAVMNAVFKPLGLRIGLLPASKAVLAQLAEYLATDSASSTSAAGIRGFTR